jgi:hypothetical protein
MPSHFASIGFHAETEEEFLALAEQVVAKCTTLEVPNGRYLRWTSDCGAELWLRVDSWNELAGMKPHFAGQPGMRAGLTCRVRQPDCSDLDGGFHAWAEPAAKQPEKGIYPFVFDTPDYDRHDRLRLPSLADVQVAAFAHSLVAFDSEDAFQDAQDPEARFPVESFIPAGLFSPDGTPTDPPVAFAVLSGRVLATQLHENPITGALFAWARLRTLGGELDLVVEPEVVRGEMKRGGVVTGSFWLSGRLHSHAK